MITFSYFLPIISHGDKKIKSVALTFDDGPDPEITPHLLKLLSKHSIKATFFVVGQKISRNPEIINSILKNGHSIGNHSNTHSPALMFKSNLKLTEEIKSVQEILHQFGIKPIAFRPPIGITNPKLWRVLLNHGMICVNFSCRAFDRGNRNIKNIANKILKKIKPGDIILLHDTIPDKNFNLIFWLDEIEKIIIGLKEKNIKIAKLSEIIKNPVMRRNDELSNPISTFYNGLASEYDKEQFNSPVSFTRKKEYEIILSRLPDLISSSDNVLEIGAGTGLITTEISKLCNTITALDISIEMLDRLKLKCKTEKINNINYKLCDIENSTFEKKYDMICSFSSFEYISDLKSLIIKLSFNLNTNGIIYFTTAHLSLLKLFSQIGNAMRQGLWLHSRRKRYIQKILEEANIEPILISTHILKSFFSRGVLLEVIGKKKT